MTTVLGACRLERIFHHGNVIEDDSVSPAAVKAAWVVLVQNLLADTCTQWYYFCLCRLFQEATCTVVCRRLATERAEMRTAFLERRQHVELGEVCLRKEVVWIVWVQLLLVVARIMILEQIPG